MLSHLTMSRHLIFALDQVTRIRSSEQAQAKAGDACAPELDVVIESQPLPHPIADENEVAQRDPE